MKTFYTLTDEDTKYCNSRSKRFDTFEEAQKEAEQRVTINSTGARRAIFIMQAVAIVDNQPRVVQAHTTKITDTRPSFTPKPIRPVTYPDFIFRNDGVRFYHLKHKDPGYYTSEAQMFAPFKWSYDTLKASGAFLDI